MKRLISFIVVSAFCLASLPAFAANFTSKVPFSNISAASAAVKTSDVYNVSGKRFKTLHVSGVTLTSSLSSITYKNMSGTFIAECAPTSSGPWSTCVANDYAQTAVSRTTNGNFTWADISNYVRLKWTSGTVGGKLKAWFNFSD